MNAPTAVLPTPALTATVTHSSPITSSLGDSITSSVLAPGDDAPPFDFVFPELRSAGPIFVDGSHVYVATEDRVTIYDATEPASPVLMSRTERMQGLIASSISDIEVRHGALYVAVPGWDTSFDRPVPAPPAQYPVQPAVITFDVRDPLSPTMTHIAYSPGGAADLEVHGDTLFVAAQESGVRRFDISNPLAPVNHGTIPAGTAMALVADGDRLYVADGGTLLLNLLPSLRFGGPDGSATPLPTKPSGVRAFALDDDRVSEIGYQPILDPVTTMALADGHLFLAIRDGVVVLDAGDTASLAIVTVVSTVFQPTALGLSDGLLFIATAHPGGLEPAPAVQIVDVSTPGFPRPVAEIESSNGATAVSPVGDVLYYTSGGGLYAADVSDPTRPSLPEPGTSARGRAVDVIVDGPTAYLLDQFQGLQIYDVTKAATPRRVSALSVRTSHELVDTQLGLSGDHAYVVAGLRFVIVNVADPVKPAVVGSVDLHGFGDLFVNDVTVASHFVYVTSAAEGVIVIDVSDPKRPREVSRLDVYDPTGIVVTGGYGYVPSFDGLEVFDLSDPSQPARTEVVDEVPLLRLTVRDSGTLFASHVSPGIAAFDIRSPGDPRVLGTLDWPHASSDLALRETDLFVGTRDDGVHHIDVSDPATPRHRARVTDRLPVTSLAVQDSRLFVTYGEGWQIVDLSGPTPVIVYDEPRSG